MNGAVVEPACERVQEVGAMEGVIGSTEARRILMPIVEFKELAGLHVARVDSGRRRANSGNFVAEAHCLQRLDGLRTNVDRLSLIHISEPTRRS